MDAMLRAVSSNTRKSNRMGTRLTPASARRRKQVLCMAAAALSTTTLLPRAQAFTVVGPRPLSRTNLVASSTPWLTQSTASVNHHRCYHHSTTRFYSSRNDNNNSSGRKSRGILSKVGKAAKSILPTSWFQSEPEKKAAIERQKVRDEVQGGLKEMLKDAPLPLRMLGGMIAPLMSSVMSGLAESMAEQQETVQSLLTDAGAYLAADAAVAQLLGEPIQVGEVMQQSSSTSSINGQSSTRVELAFGVTGRNGSTGVARLSATEKGIQSLQLQAGGRVIAVNLSDSRPGRRMPSSYKSSDDGGDIIEAEIIEKETKR